MSKYKLGVSTGWAGANTELDLVEDLGYTEEMAASLVEDWACGALHEDIEPDLFQAALDASGFEWFLKSTDNE